MKIAIVFILSALCLCGYAQTAKVIALTPEDAKTAQDVDLQVNEALKRKSDFYEKVRLKYIGGYPAGRLNLICFSAGCEPSKHDGKDAIPGWESGFEFSDDWKYIVPLKFLYSPNLNNSCVISTIPAYAGTFVAN